MSLFGALFSGVSGLQSQSSAMGAIADNVTNVSTVGYKNTNVNFKTLITAQTSSTQYSPGGVQSAPRQAIDLQGLLQATTSSTDVAISGSGFFVTNQVAQPNNNGLFTYSRAGSFKVDREGFLQNSAGAYLQGWPLTVYDGSAGASTIDIGSNTFMRAYIKGNGDKVLINNNVINSENVQPLNLQTIGGTASPTTTLTIGANLPAGDQVNSTSKVNGLIFDSLGNSHNLSITYTKTAANKWDSVIEPPAQAATLVQKTQKGEIFQAGGRLDFSDQANGNVTGTITVSAAGQSVTINLDPANPDSTAPFTPGGNLTVSTSGRTISQILDQLATELNGVLTDSSVYGTALSPPGTWARHIPGESSITFDQADTANTLTFSASAVDANGKQLISQSDPAGYTIPALDATYGQYTLTAGPPNVVTRNTAAIEFNGNGTPLKIFGRDSAASPDPKNTVEVVWANGAEPMQSGNTKSPAVILSQGNYNTPDGITQLSGTFQLNFLQQNGAKFGNFAGVSIDKAGVVTALFDNGVTRPVFQIPLATFTNPNGLQSLSGNVWIATDFSGNPTLRQPGDAGAGQVNAAALEASTVDLGTEFTKMITTQRAYSSSAKVITTADQMLDELLQIKR
jgi:flagellar hook protein FlgE